VVANSPNDKVSTPLKRMVSPISYCSELVTSTTSLEGVRLCTTPRTPEKKPGLCRRVLLCISTISMWVVVSNVSVRSWGVYAENAKANLRTTTRTLVWPLSIGACLGQKCY